MYVLSSWVSGNKLALKLGLIRVAQKLFITHCSAHPQFGFSSGVAMGPLPLLSCQVLVILMELVWGVWGPQFGNRSAAELLISLCFREQWTAEILHWKSWERKLVTQKSYLVSKIRKSRENKIIFSQLSCRY